MCTLEKFNNDVYFQSLIIYGSQTQIEKEKTPCAIYEITPTANIFGYETGIHRSIILIPQMAFRHYFGNDIFVSKFCSNRPFVLSSVLQFFAVVLPVGARSVS